MKRCIAIAAIALTLATGSPAHASYRLLPECTIQAVVGDDFTQVDVVWADNQSVTEYAYAQQWVAARKISDILQEFACDVRWERA